MSRSPYSRRITILEKRGSDVKAAVAVSSGDNSHGRGSIQGRANIQDTDMGHVQPCIGETTCLD